MVRLEVDPHTPIWAIILIPLSVVVVLGIIISCCLFVHRDTNKPTQIKKEIDQVIVKNRTFDDNSSLTDEINKQIKYHNDKNNV